MGFASVKCALEGRLMGWQHNYRVFLRPHLYGGRQVTQRLLADVFSERGCEPEGRLSARVPSWPAKNKQVSQIRASRNTKRDYISVIAMDARLSSRSSCGRPSLSIA